MTIGKKIGFFLVLGRSITYWKSLLWINVIARYGTCPTWVVWGTYVGFILDDFSCLVYNSLKVHKVGVERTCAAAIILGAPGANYRTVLVWSKYFLNVKTFVRAHSV